jgi:hypothetical protein
MFTFLSAAGLIVLLAGLFVIASSERARSDKDISDEGSTNTRDSIPAEILGERQIAIRLGLSLNALGALFILLDLAGVTLSGSAVGIGVFLIFIFLVAHRRYARDMRAARRSA